MSELGDFIRSYREERKIALREFADLCGLSHSYIDKLEKGLDPRTNKPVIPTIDTLQKIANATGNPLEVILTKGGYIEPELPPVTSKAKPKDEREVEKYIEEMKKNLEKNEGLMLSGEPVSEEAIESILEALEYGVRQAQKINKKYTPKKYRKDNE